MTDVAHPAAPPKRRKRLAVRARSTARHAPVSFAELVQAHYMRQQALEQGKVYAGEAEERYREFEAAFQRQQGRIVNAYWCTSMPSGVALTVKQRGHGQSPDLFFHRVSDWATKEEP